MRPFSRRRCFPQPPPQASLRLPDSPSHLCTKWCSPPLLLLPLPPSSLLSLSNTVYKCWTCLFSGHLEGDGFWADLGKDLNTARSHNPWLQAGGLHLGGNMDQQDVPTIECTTPIHSCTLVPAYPSLSPWIHSASMLADTSVAFLYLWHTASQGHSLKNEMCQVNPPQSYSYWSRSR